MRRLLNRSVQFALVAMLVVSAQSLAAVSVSGPETDHMTQGDWRGVYGECFVLVPGPEPLEIEVPTGPELWSQNPAQYANNTCGYGELLDQGAVDWRIFRANNDNAFSWHFGMTHPTPMGAAQWNPCLMAYRHATWDSDDHANDPLSIEVTLDTGGDIQLAYYLTDGDNICRDINWTLTINGMVEKMGFLVDYAEGVYLVFEVTDLPAGPNVILFEGEDAPGSAVCSEPREYEGVNTHISGVFISGSDACTDQPFCGDDVLDPGEECDDGNNVDGDGCSANCTIEPFCGDDVLDPGEECDDGNNVDGDGCSADCTIEPFCGDDVLDPGEECDDGNNVDGDGCSATCDFEVFDGEGCTPGYWKGPHHHDDWNSYSPFQSFSSVFNREITVRVRVGRSQEMVTDPTLLQALKALGNDNEIDAFARHTVAALLNADSNFVNYVNYPTVDDVIVAAQAAIDGGTTQMQHYLFHDSNEEGCPL